MFSMDFLVFTNDAFRCCDLMSFFCCCFCTNSKCVSINLLFINEYNFKWQIDVVIIQIHIQFTWVQQIKEVYTFSSFRDTFHTLPSIFVFIAFSAPNFSRFTNNFDRWHSQNDDFLNESVLMQPNQMMKMSENTKIIN